MRFGSLFSGIGGFDLGFERAGMECAWQCEIDKHCQDILTKHFGVKIYDDVRTITAGNTEPVDVICGGFPCQDVSIAGKRAGFAGERSGLWAEFARIIGELKPGWVVIENVPGLLSSNRGYDFKTVLDQMVEYGYGVCWRILDAQYFGVAQRRRRVFIVGSLGNGRSAEVLFESEGVRWNPPPRGKEGEGATGTTAPSLTASQYSKLDHQGIESGQYVTAYENHPADSRITETGDISQQLTSRMGTGGGNVPRVAHSLVLNDQGGSQMSITEDVSATLRTQEHGHQPLVMGEVANTLAGGSSKAHSDMTSGQQDGNIVCTTLTASNDPSRSPQSQEITQQVEVVNRAGFGVRRLTPTECERLQGFPDGWTFGSDSTRYKQLGNAVAVPVAEWIGNRIIGGQL